MQISPWPVGQTYPLLAAQLILSDGTIVAGLATATFSLLIRSVPAGTDMVGAGTFGSINMGTGTVLYTWAAADVALAGVYQLYVKATYTDSTVTKFGPVDWRVVPV
jgi:hypothetical protein